MSPLRRCRRCHRVLKDEESIRQGIGPVCRLKDTAMQIELFEDREYNRGLAISEIEQDALVKAIIHDRLAEMLRDG